LHSAGYRQVIGHTSSAARAVAGCPRLGGGPRPRLAFPTGPRRCCRSSPSHATISSRFSISGIAVHGTPGCLPGQRPDEVRDERRVGLRYGEFFDDVACARSRSPRPAIVPQRRFASLALPAALLRTGQLGLHHCATCAPSCAAGTQSVSVLDVQPQLRHPAHRATIEPRRRRHHRGPTSLQRYPKVLNSCTRVACTSFAGLTGAASLRRSSSKG
jgi:hypothetical protein